MRLAVCIGLEYLILSLAGITVDVEVLSHMKLTKYTFSLLQHESTMFFYLEEELLLVHVSLFAPENNFPPDHTEDIGWNFVFTDKVKRLKIPFSWYLYRLYRFKEVNLALLYYYQPAWHTCGRYTMKTILLNRGRLGTKTSIFKYSAPTCSVTAHRLEIYKRKDVRWKNWKKGNENV